MQTITESVVVAYNILGIHMTCNSNPYLLRTITIFFKLKYNLSDSMELLIFCRTKINNWDLQV